MNSLDEPESYAMIDRAHMHERLASQPQQYQEAFDLATLFHLPASYRDIRQVVIAGMGGSALGAALIQGAYSSKCLVPITIWRNYGLPGYARGPETLVIATSHSGETEETLNAAKEAVRRGCRLIAICTGGRLAQQVQETASPTFLYAYNHTPREGIAWLSMPVLAILSSLGYVSSPAEAVTETVAVLSELQNTIGVSSPTARNPAKRLAGQVMDRLPIIYGSGMLNPVAQRWKTVLNENAKMLATWDAFPELNHNTIIGYEHPEAVWNKSIVIQLRRDGDDPRMTRRMDLTTQLMLEAGINQDTVRARGNSALSQVFSLVYFGDWVSYYAAIISGLDPTPTDAIQQLKRALKD